MGGYVLPSTSERRHPVGCTHEFPSLADDLVCRRGHRHLFRLHRLRKPLLSKAESPDSCRKATGPRRNRFARRRRREYPPPPLRSHGPHHPSSPVPPPI